MKITLRGEIMPGRLVPCEICGRPFELDEVSARFSDETRKDNASRGRVMGSLKFKEKTNGKKV
jgi:hypothetical protein